MGIKAGPEAGAGGLAERTLGDAALGALAHFTQPVQVRSLALALKGASGQLVDDDHQDVLLFHDPHQ